MGYATSCSTTRQWTVAISALGVAVASFLAIPGAIGAEELLDAGYKSSSHRLVIITEDALKPRTLTLEEGQLVAWVNYSQRASTEQPSRIAWTRAGTRAVSKRISRRAQASEFPERPATSC